MHAVWDAWIPREGVIVEKCGSRSVPKGMVKRPFAVFYPKDGTLSLASFGGVLLHVPEIGVLVQGKLRVQRRDRKKGGNQRE